jgi:prepilin-type N-terminal cleavage/methylation domain-containing protein/prepilin-type processing-associated H-X9-DG protein
VKVQAALTSPGEAWNRSGSSRKPDFQFPPRRLGFTLVELLTTLTIVALLAALTVPAIQGVQSKTRATQCAGNVRQLGVALNSFVSESHEFPLFLNPGYRTGVLPEHRTVWWASLYPAAPADTFFETGVWDCPSARKPESWADNDIYTDYGYNAYGMGTFAQGDDLGMGSSSANRKPVKEGDVTAPADTYALGDGLLGSPAAIEDGNSLLWRNKGAKDHFGSTERARRRHGAKANVAFAEGHVEAVPLTTLFVEESDAALSRWNRDHQPHRERLNR